MISFHDKTMTSTNSLTSCGVYVVRSVNDRRVVRIGVGGARSSKQGSLASRLRKHSKFAPKTRTCETHNQQPFKVEYAAEFVMSNATLGRDAERIVYAAFLSRFSRYKGTLPDDSLFPIHDEERLAEAFLDVAADLSSYANVTFQVTDSKD